MKVFTLAILAVSSVVVTSASPITLSSYSNPNDVSQASAGEKQESIQKRVDARTLPPPLSDIQTAVMAAIPPPPEAEDLPPNPLAPPQDD
ncbi:hypothetical protein BJV82DRAFT_233649 [Fennellomyces sp. T-0311]|nr:hypothetical protein BJV82DRAFT_233649 [Fennellomyces sp. T-0311]